jgi:hypothetical protein
MATTSKRLENILSDLSVICVESQRHTTLKQKFVNREKAQILVREATELLDNLQEEIKKFDEKNVNSGQLNRYIDLLTNNSNFDETLYVVNMLRSINAGVPTKSEITNNVEQEVIYEEQDINDF